MNILGFNIGVRGSAACLVRDGVPATAAREEWFSRVRFDAAPPERAVRCCLELAGLEPGAIDAVVRVGRAEGRLASLSSWFALPRRGPLDSAHVVADAQAALAGAFYPSDFDQAAILVLNGLGQGLGSAAGVGEGNRIRLLYETPPPHGPGALYAALASRLQRRYPQDEAELMDLAGLGRPRHIEMLRREWIELLDDGVCRFRLDEKSTESCGPIGEHRVEHRQRPGRVEIVRQSRVELLAIAVRRLRGGGGGACAQSLHQLHQPLQPHLRRRQILP